MTSALQVGDAIVSSGALAQARAVERPTRDAMLRRDPAVGRFWEENKQLFSAAWAEWETTGQIGESVLDRSLYDARLRTAIERSWQDPQQESAVAELWRPVVPGVMPPKAAESEARPANYRPPRMPGPHGPPGLVMAIVFFVSGGALVVYAFRYFGKLKRLDG